MAPVGVDSVNSETASAVDSSSVGQAADPSGELGRDGITPEGEVPREEDNTDCLVGGREGGQDGGREDGLGGEREGGREEGREGGREGGRDGGREGGREGGRDDSRDVGIST